MVIDPVLMILAGLGLNLLYNIMLSRRISKLSKRTEMHELVEHDLGLKDKADYEVVRTK